MKYLGYIYIFLLMTGCAFYQSLPGNYEFKNNSLTPDHYELALNSDQSFRYYISTDMLGKEIFEGYWERFKDTLTLIIKKPNLDSSKVDRIFEEYETNGSSSKTINVKMQNDSPLVGAYVYLNESPKGVLTNGEGKVSIDIDTVKQIRIKYFLLDTDRVLKPVDPFARKYRITLFDQNLEPLLYTFPYRKWIIRKNKLIPISDHAELLMREEFIRI